MDAIIWHCCRYFIYSPLYGTNIAGNTLSSHTLPITIFIIAMNFSNILYLSYPIFSTSFSFQNSLSIPKPFPNKTPNSNAKNSICFGDPNVFEYIFAILDISSLYISVKTGRTSVGPFIPLISMISRIALRLFVNIDASSGMPCNIPKIASISLSLSLPFKICSSIA